jgi:23S rRNA pseudouridine1911/1915/1917 synthase
LLPSTYFLTVIGNPDSFPTFAVNNYKVKATVRKSYSLFEFLEEIYPDSPRTRIKKILHSGDIRVNGMPVTLHSYQLKPGDEVEISKTGAKTTVKGSPFNILYEDNHIIIIDKPAGISTSSVDGSRNVRDVLSAWVRDQTKGKERVWVIHRLDKEVSGIVMFAKSEEVTDMMKEKWEETEKHYYAYVEGVPEKPQGVIESWLKEDNRQKVYSTTEQENAKFAVTEYKIIKRKEEYSLLDVSIKTGRKNQIRVHLADIGCPIVGDRKYGASSEYIRRVRLHAYSLSFPHPVTGKPISITTPIPKGFMDLKEANEKYK